MHKSIAEVEGELLGRCMDLERQLGFYKRLYTLALTRNTTCACKIDPDTDELLAPCGLHEAWRGAAIDYALKHRATKMVALPEDRFAGAGKDT